MKAQKRRGFTLVEVIVVMAIISILAATILPALSAAREQARRATCAGHLERLGMALHAYELAQGVFPPGVSDPVGPIRNEAKGIHVGWMIHLLPYCEEGTAYQHIDLKAGVYDPGNAVVRSLRLNLLLCPSSLAESYRERNAAENAAGPAPAPASAPDADAVMPEPRDLGVALSHYAACYNDLEEPIDAENHGVLFRNSRVSAQDITDGTTYTILIGEKRGVSWSDLGWMSGTRATLRNAGTPINGTNEDSPWQTAKTGLRPPADPPLTAGGFGSCHARATHFLMADGAVLPVNETIAPAVLRQLANRSDGQLLLQRDLFQSAQ